MPAAKGSIFPSGLIFIAHPRQGTNDFPAHQSVLPKPTFPVT